MTSAPLALALATAAQLIADVMGGRSLDEALTATRLEGAGRAAVQNLCYGALRGYGRGDFLLQRLMERPLRDAVVRGLLLAAIHRIAERPADTHTTVDQAVRAAATMAGGKYKGLVNGVLRNYLRRQAELDMAVADDDVARLQHPRWWLDQLITAHPRDWQAIATVGNGHPPMCLRVNRRHGDAGAYVAELQSAGLAARPLDDTAVMLEKPVSVERLPGFREGRVSVQDWGAQQAARLLGVSTGMRVLDACAAPGGKTGHLAELADLDLLALDMEAARAARISENLARLHLAATVTVADCRVLGDWWDGRGFDRILADVPCSASGVVRRHPDIKWLRRPGDVDKFAQTQAQILTALWPALAPGGRMLYCTCSVFPRENAQQVAGFAARHADAILLPTIVAGNGDNDGQLLPTADHDGFYYALLEKAP